MFKVIKDSQFEDSEVPFLREKGINLGIILGIKVSFLAFFVDKNVPFLDKKELKRYLYFYQKVPTRAYKSPDETHFIDKLLMLLALRL